MQKKINLFVIMLLISTLFFGFMSINVVAWDDRNIVEWDEYQIGVTSGSSDFYSWETTIGSDGYIIVHSINGSVKSLFQRYLYTSDDDDTTIISFVYDEGTTIDGFYFYFDLVDFAGASAAYGADTLYNNYVFKKTGVTQLKFRAFYTMTSPYRTLYVQWLNQNDTYINLMVWQSALPISKSLKVFINFSHVCASGDVFNVKLYSSDGVTKYGEINDTMVIWDGDFTYFDELEITTDGNRYSGALEGDVYIGEIHINTDYDVSSTDFPVEQWDYIGELNNDGDYGLPAKSIEEQYQLEFTGEIKAVDLFVHRDQINLISNSLSDYILYINVHLESLSFHPVAFIPYQNHYLIRWYWINQTINSTYITFEWACLGENPANYQNWRVILSATDNDGDGNINFKWGEDANAWINGLFDQTHTENYDLSMRFYYIGDIYDPNYNYPDWIGIKDNPPYYTYVNIPISYTISTKEYDNYMEIWKDGERVGSDQGFGSTGENGMLLSEYSTTIGFVPLESGDYSVNIRRNSVNVTVYAFTVLDNPITDYYIYTIPNPSQYPNAFTVYYRYFHGEGKDGILTIHNIQDFSDPLSHLYVLYLDANTTGNFSYTPQRFYDLLYITMGIEISIERYTIASFPNNPYIHYIKDYAVTNYIDLAYDIIYFETSHTQTVTGHHNHIGACVYVQDNGEIIQDVSNKNSFTFSYTVVNSGNHKVDLVLSTTNGTVILDTEYFVASTEEEEEEEDEFEALGEYKMWLGVGVVVLCLLLPLVISLKSFVDVPLIVYIAMGSIGAGISVSLGLLELYWLLLLMVALVAGAVISKWGL